MNASRPLLTLAAAALLAVFSSRVESASMPATAANSPSWRVAWADSLTKVFRNRKSFHGQSSPAIQLSLARNEYESAQLILIGGAQPARVSVRVGPIVRMQGSEAFPADVVEIRLVGYVRTRKPYYPVPAAGDWPDPLPLGSEVSVPANAVAPVWITLGAPEHMIAGEYSGTITLTDARGQTQTIALEVRVWDFALERTLHLKTAFGVYRNRLISAYQEFVPHGVLWAGRIDELQRLCDLELLKRHISPMMDADPFSSGFGEQIAFYRSIGLTAFGVDSHGGNDDNNWPSDPEALGRIMAAYGDIEQNLLGRGLLDLAYVYAYDEPKRNDPRVPQILGALHQAAPDLRRLLVMHEAADPEADRQWMKDADILCTRIASFNPQHAQEWIKQGKEVWLYVSSPVAPFPGLVIDEPAIHHRLIPWMCWKYGASGLLYWCVNYWKADPWVNPATFADDQNGNGVLLYPSPQGPVTSIRLENLRDGIEDYEYLYTLRGLLQRAQERVGLDPGLLQEARRLISIDASLIASLGKYTDDAGRLINYRNTVAETIERLHQALATGT